MELSRRIYIKNYPSTDDFLQYRQCSSDSIVPALVIYCLEAFLIYERRLLGPFLDKLNALAPGLAGQHVGDLKQLFAAMTVEMFDKLTYDTSFIQYVQALSVTFRSKHMASSQSAMVEAFAQTFRVPVYFFTSQTPTIFDEPGNYVDFFPVHIHLKDNGAAILEYPSHAYAQQLRAARQAPAKQKSPRNPRQCTCCGRPSPNMNACPAGCQICGDCWMTEPCQHLTAHMQKSTETCAHCRSQVTEAFSCPKGCPICNRCWRQTVNEEDTYDCPSCYFLLNDQMRHRLDQFLSKTERAPKKVVKAKKAVKKKVAQPVPVPCNKCGSTGNPFLCDKQCACEACVLGKLDSHKESLSCKECGQPYPQAFLTRALDTGSTTKFMCSVCKTRNLPSLTFRKCRVCSDGLICAACLRQNPEITSQTCSCKTQYSLSQVLLGNMPQLYGYADCCKKKSNQLTFCPASHKHIIHQDCVTHGKCPVCLAPMLS